MKCPSCGAENPDKTILCLGCGNPLELRFERAKAKESGKVQPTKSFGGLSSDGKGEADRPVDHKEIPGKMKFDYLRCMRDPTQRCLDGLQGLLTHFREPRINIDGMLSEAANLITRQFGIDNVAIGLKDPADGLYKYRAMVGFRDSALEEHRQITYTREQFFANGHFIGSDISRLSRLYLAEDNVLTEEEKNAFNRPVLLTVRRRTTADSLEGDYIDTKIYGPDDDLLGWIEISGTRGMKLPDVATVKWVEVIASTIGAALMFQGSRRDGR